MYPGSGAQGIACAADAERVAAHCAELSARALAGEPSAMRDNFIYAGAICLFYIGRTL